jgi:hypothetical protein
LYVAVIATALQSKLCQRMNKLQQMREALEQAREAFRQAKAAGVDRETLESKAAALVEANESLERFMARYPELAGRR